MAVSPFSNFSCLVTILANLETSEIGSISKTTAGAAGGGASGSPELY